jgi:hypothetical protein
VKGRGFGLALFICRFACEAAIHHCCGIPPQPLIVRPAADKPRRGRTRARRRL